MDEIDRAQTIAETFQTESLKRHLSQTATSAESLTFCEECEEEIPPRRRQLVQGCRLCWACKNKQENNIRRGR